MRESCAHSFQEHRKMSRQILNFAFDGLLGLNLVKGRRYAVRILPRHNAVQSRSVPYSVAPSLSQVLGHVGSRPGCLLAGDPINHRASGTKEQLHDVETQYCPDDVKWDRMLKELSFLPF